MGLKDLLFKKEEIATLKEAELFFQHLGVDINTLGLPGVGPDIPKDSKEYTRTFENLRAVYHESVTGPSIRILGDYNCVYDGKNEGDEDNQMFRQKIEEYDIDYIIPLSKKSQEKEK